MLTLPPRRALDSALMRLSICDHVECPYGPNQRTSSLQPLFCCGPSSHAWSHQRLVRSGCRGSAAAFRGFNMVAPDLLTAGQVAAKDIGDLAIPLINVTGDEVGRHPDFENHCSSSIEHAIGGPTGALTSH